MSIDENSSRQKIVSLKLVLALELNYDVAELL